MTRSELDDAAVSAIVSNIAVASVVAVAFSSQDGATQFNEGLMKEFMAFERVYVAGQAKSHCVNFTVRDMVSNYPPAGDKSKVVVLEDCMSSVPGFEGEGDKFLEDMRKEGVAVAKAADVKA